ncbi:MAG: hypothetical protein CMJ93_03600 [Planctomycetes bacterium]|nr:hypothetical protein [Planctomycetota bacterium]|tara:strand:+ start:2056 stop:2262 length:207 start_codon:yes stop_codon:yes gene_type:complete
MMGSPIVMTLLLLFFSTVLGVVASCYRFDSRKEILDSLPRRTLTFALVVAGFGVVAYVLSATALMPTA